MSQENVDLVRSIYAAWERGDYSSVDWAHPEIQYVMEMDISSSTWTGPNGLVEGTREWMAVWKDMSFEAHEYRELDDERVLVLFRFSGRGKTSGLAIDQIHAMGAHIFHIRDGKVMKLVSTPFASSSTAVGLMMVRFAEQLRRSA
jgi:ketosteroid isomerase-like protein